MLIKITIFLDDNDKKHKQQQTSLLLINKINIIHFRNNYPTLNFNLIKTKKTLNLILLFSKTIKCRYFF